MVFWRTFGEVVGTIADAAAEAKRNRQNRIADYNRPIEVHVIDSELRRHYRRGMVFHSGGFLPDRFVLLKEDETRPQSWIVGELLSDNSTCILRKRKMSEGQIQNNLFFSHYMNEDQFHEIIRWNW